MKTFCFLLLALGLFWNNALAASSAQEEKPMSPIGYYNVDGKKVWILSLDQRDMPASVLMPRTGEEQQAVAAAYPDGKVRNSLNVMLVQGEGYLALVDTGLPNTQPGLVARLKELGFTPADITDVIITHSHGDHIGGLVTPEGAALFPNARIVLTRAEHGWWSDPANKAATPERAQAMFAQLPAALAPYSGKVQPVEPGEVLPGLKLLPAYGHTPGHTAVLLPSPKPGETTLFWADLLHALNAQVRFPSISATFDMDPATAMNARVNMLNEAAANAWRVTGTHVPAPSTWDPAEWN